MSCQFPDCSGCSCNHPMAMAPCDHCLESHAFVFKKNSQIYNFKLPDLNIKVLDVDYKRRVYTLQHVGTFNQFEISFAGGWKEYTDLPPGKVGNSTYSYCDHRYVDVGFHFTKLVCLKCNEEKK